MEIPGDSGQSEPGPNASLWPTDFMEKLQSVSLSPREETLSDRGPVCDVGKAELSSQSASQVLWSTGTLSSPIPNGFYSIIPVRRIFLFPFRIMPFFRATNPTVVKFSTVKFCSVIFIGCSIQ